MKTAWKHFVVCSLCLTTLVLASGTPLKSDAATRIPGMPHAARTCDIRNNAYPTNYAYPASSADLSGPPTEWSASASDPSEPDVVVTFAELTPSDNYMEVGAWTCGTHFLELVAFNRDSDNPIVPDTYIVYLTANGITTVNYLSPSDFSTNNNLDWPTTELSVQAHQAYTISLEACQNNGFCEGSDPLQIAMATDPFCQDGYVWRQIYWSDHVCVQPWEAIQVQQDNRTYSDGSRFAPGEGHTCISGYVWRQAWPFDQVCVTPDQRSQVANDNSQALNRIVAL